MPRPGPARGFRPGYRRAAAATAALLVVVLGAGLYLGAGTVWGPVQEIQRVRAPDEAGLVLVVEQQSALNRELTRYGFTLADDGVLAAGPLRVRAAGSGDWAPFAVEWTDGGAWLLPAEGGHRFFVPAP
ncbi:hypothetical protein CLV72_1083 [Allonocardiopsis opalescens]|uniref:Uncharacterized protein n=1 Tax=Allonocardiopsis opalescens TaxID=1144618 RepID=A0A2T0PWS7_9ACTN|nr:hypothetical protein CLV72_1083 [Allonocardiopsis opalescens]